MNREIIEQAFFNAVKRLKFYAPFDTGNLRENAIRYEWRDNKTFVIYVDQNIAPYMPYTNEPWTAERWKGKKNPNEAWWQGAVEAIAEVMAIELNGKLTVGKR